MSSEKSGDIGCHNCPKSACCRAGIAGWFTRKEAAFLERAGTVLLPLQGERDNQEYALVSDCGHLGVDVGGKTFCTQHENPDRPEACRSFEAGSMECRLQREMQGVVPSGFNRIDFLRGEE